MKTFTIELFAVETNFQGRANYEFAKALDEFLIKHKKRNGTPLGEDMAVFVTMMTKKEAQALKDLEPLLRARKLKTSIVKGDPSET